MSQNEKNNAVVIASQIATAQKLHVTSSEIDAVKASLPSFGGDLIPISVTFHQEAMKPKYGLYAVEVEELETVKRMIGEKEITFFTYDEEKDENGNITRKPRKTGKHVWKKERFEHEKVSDNRQVTIDFLCSKEQLGNVCGEAFTLLKKADFRPKVGKPLSKSYVTNMTLKMRDKEDNLFILSTKSLSYGGCKLSKVYTKGQLDKAKFSADFCAVLYGQLKDAFSGMANKPLDVPTEILQAVGLSEAAK